MFRTVLKYEVRRAALPMLCIYAAALVFALLARCNIFSLTDMPLVYLMIFSTIGVLIYRFQRTMFGQEATLLFSTALSAYAHVMVLVLIFFLACNLTTLAIGAALIIQGEALGNMLRAIPMLNLITLYIEVVFSLFFCAIIFATIVTLSHQPGCRAQKLIWTIVYGCVVFAVIAALSSLTAPLIKMNVVISESKGIFISDTHIHESSVALSLNLLIWYAISAPVCLFIIGRETKAKLLVE